MRTIWKYRLELTDHQTLSIREPAIILHIGIQNGAICIWVIVDEAETERDITFHIIGTGHNVPEAPCRHLGTVEDGAFVWHIFVEDLN